MRSAILQPSSGSSLSKAGGLPNQVGQSVDKTVASLHKLHRLTEGACGVHLVTGEAHSVNVMKDMAKIIVLTVLVLALAPFAGFWIVALIGASLLLLPAAAVVARLFPKAWQRLEGNLWLRTHVA